MLVCDENQAAGSVQAPVPIRAQGELARRRRELSRSALRESGWKKHEKERSDKLVGCDCYTLRSGGFLPDARPMRRRTRAGKEPRSEAVKSYLDRITVPSIGEKGRAKRIQGKSKPDPTRPAPAI